MQKQMESGAFSLAKTARYIGVSSPTVLKMIRDGTLPHKRYGKRYIVAKTAIDKWLESDIGEK